MATDLVTIATTAVLSQFLGPSAKHLGEQALERGKQIGTKAVAYLTAVGREPQPVEPKVLLPLVQAASLETDETLTEKWAALLANAADPLSERNVTPVYGDILRQLTSQEVKVLNMLFVEASPEFHNPSPPNKDRQDDQRLFIKSWVTSHMLNPGLSYTIKIRNEGKAAYTMQERIEYDRLDAMIDNFLRQQILILAKSAPLKDKPSNSDLEPKKNKVFFTSLGYDFMLAVTPPTP
jgi:hypothetical protein